MFMITKQQPLCSHHTGEPVLVGGIHRWILMQQHFVSHMP